MNGKRIIFPAVALLALVAVVSGCSDQADDPTAGVGRVTVQVHDQAAPQLEEAWVTFDSVAFRDRNGVWVDAEVPPGTEIDLLTLIGPDAAVTVASDLVAEGIYDAVRLGVAAARVTVGGETTDVPLPEGGTTIVVPVPEFTVEAGVETLIVIDVPVEPTFRIVGTDVVFTPSATLTSMSTR